MDRYQVARVRAAISVEMPFELTAQQLDRVAEIAVRTVYAWAIDTARRDTSPGSEASGDA